MFLRVDSRNVRRSQRVGEDERLTAGMKPLGQIGDLNHRLGLCQLQRYFPLISRELVLVLGAIMCIEDEY